jgi:predicted nucleic acid-binding protein
MAKRKKPRTRAAEFVLDGSVTLAWAFDDETSPYTEAVADSLDKIPAIVPQLWPLEVANGLLVGARHKRTTEAKVAAFLTLLAKLPIAVDDQTALRAWQETLHLAQAQNLSAYDAAYLELAMRHDMPMATIDEQLKRAAAVVGVPLYRP